MALEIDQHHQLASSIQRWDPRFKIASLGIFVLGVAVLQTLPLAMVALLLAIGFCRISRLPYAFVKQGLAWVVPFLLPFFLILPFSYPGTAAYHVLGLPFAWEGLRLAALIFLKAVAIVMISYVIFGSARFDVSMIALQRLRCPAIFVQMILFTYRYTYVFIDEMRRMNTAMSTRGFVKRMDLHTFRVVGGFVGTLLIRSFERTERVFKAMLSKGFQGEFHTLVEFSAGPRDAAKMVLVVGVIVVLTVCDRIGPFHAAIQAWY
ncbi:MAG: cobalt ECF transporter T component CbiQ [Gammaproteobacteria bacterium]|nr:MAG: cobalt ECF transporter T component CbiQ [Gammaproteobacteria bacterium]